MMDRRLPVYILLDCSESMAGEAIEQVQRGMQSMVDVLQSDPMAIESAWLSTISFSGFAKQDAPLTEITRFQMPRLSIGPGTALGSALKVLLGSIKREVKQTSASEKGDYRPIVFLFTDGQPTDEWQGAAEQIRKFRDPGIANIYAIGCGPDVDTDILRNITDIVLSMNDTSPEGWRKTFIWLTASLQTTSKAVQSGESEESLVLTDLPADALELAPQTMGVRDPRPRQVFLYAWCTKNAKPYLMRFSRDERGDVYQATSAHKLEHIEHFAGSDLPPINTSSLSGVPPCPYCGHPIAVVCDCGAISCASSDPNYTMDCPKCHATGDLDDSQGFDVHRAEG